MNLRTIARSGGGLGLACILLWAAPALADGPGPLPIALTVAPKSAILGSPVEISGTTTPDGKRFDVAVLVKTGNKPPIPLTAHIDQSGAFKVVFTATSEPGSYDVKAVAPDKEGAASTTFRVIAAANVADESAAALNQVFSAASRLQSGLTDAIAALPESPAKVELVAKSGALAAKLAQIPQIKSAINAAIKRTADLPQRAPRLASAAAPVLAKLADWSLQAPQEAEEKSTKILRELSQSSSAGVKCEQLDAVAEGFRAFSAIANLIGEPLDWIKGFANDLVGSKFADALSSSGAYNDDTAFVAAEFEKSALALVAGPAAWVGGALAICVDTAAYASDKAFKQYCERFAGPFKATMRGEVFKGSDTWWTFSMALDGTLTLRYPKGPTGEAIHMNGEFVGGAHDYKAWDDALRVLYPKLTNGIIAFRRASLPTALPLVSFEGRYASNLNPAAFIVPVEADLVGRKLTLHVGQAITELGESYNRTTVTTVVVSPLSLAPVAVTYPLPYPPARTVILRALDADEGTFELDVDIGAKSMTAKREITRTKPGNGVKGMYTGSVRLCNPACAQ